jgi:DNA repair exonuclease SbcCD nuclease subunit
VSETRFIHTADLHLRKSDEEESLQLLSWLLAKCSEREAALLVAGDFFDSIEDAAGLAEGVAQVFAGSPNVGKFILSGCHDAGAFEEMTAFGDEVRVFSQLPYTSVVHQDVHIVGFPFVQGSSLRAQLDEYQCPGRPLIALTHGTFFGQSTTSFFTDVRERAAQYFPVYGSDLEDIEANYVALGHYHSQHASFLHKNIVVCYPGTPIALTRKESGIRTVVAVTMRGDSGEVDIERLPVPVGVYNAREEIFVFACEEQESLASVEQLLRERADNRAALTVRLKGNIHMLERDINEHLAKLRDQYEGQYADLVLRNETVSFRHLIDERSLVRDFISRLAAREELDEETRARALELGLHAFDRAKGRLR